MIQPQQQSINLNANIIFLGDTQVGKSTFIDYIENGPRPTNKPAIQMSMGLEAINKEYNIDNAKLRVRIWDTVGNQKLRDINKTIYRQAHGALLILDISCHKDKEEIKSELEEWISGFREWSGDETPVVLIGNKCDLEEDEELVEGIEEFARENKMMFEKTSAKIGTNVDVVMENLIKEIYEKNFKDLSGEFQRIMMEKKSFHITLANQGDSSWSDKSNCCSS